MRAEQGVRVVMGTGEETVAVGRVQGAGEAVPLALLGGTGTGAVGLSASGAPGAVEPQAPGVVDAIGSPVSGPSVVDGPPVS